MSATTGEGQRRFFVELDHRLEVAQWGSPPVDGSDGGPTLVLLHHGLGSVDTWGALPARLAEATGRSVMAYSRWGYGRSEPVSIGELPRPVEFMHDEARGDLPALLAACGVSRPLLVGHSDGGSIALLYASFRRPPPPVGLVLLAPHVFVEEVTLAGAREAVRAYEQGELRQGLARAHADPDSAFGLWSRTWLQPGFERWSIEAELATVPAGCPVTVLQGDGDEYGTGAQLDTLRRGLGRVEDLTVELLEGCGHLLPRDRPEAVLGAVSRMVMGGTS